MVQLYVEPELAQDAATLRVSIENDEQSMVLEHEKALSGETGRIARIPLIPRGADPGRRFVVHADLLDGAGAVLATLEAHAGYTEHELRSLNLWFQAACRDEQCGAGRTCQQGQCRGACFETDSAEATEPSVPGCSECETCQGRCSADDTLQCGCAGDSCSAGECVPRDRVAFVGAGYFHTCAALTTGAVYCWGISDQWGRLGSGAGAASTTPLLVPDVIGSDGLVVSGQYNCALSPDTRYCWGDNALGELGTGQISASELTPVALDNSALGLTSLAVGFQHTCGVAQDEIWCWGHNETGELGLGAASDPVPTPTAVGSGYARVTAGGAHTCGLKTSGELECWGLNESLEVGVPAGRVIPAPARPGCDDASAGNACFVDYSSVGAGGFHTCAIRKSGALFCWGGNRDGQLGIGPSLGTEDIVEPQPVAPEIRWSEVAGGLHFSCGLDLEGTLYCWGRNESRQLGLPASGTVWTPTRVEVDAPDGFRLMSLGENHACAIRADRTLWCWGKNAEGQIGIGTTSENPVEKPTRVCF